MKVKDDSRERKRVMMAFIRVSAEAEREYRERRARRTCRASRSVGDGEVGVGSGEVLQSDGVVLGIRGKGGGSS